MKTYHLGCNQVVILTENIVITLDKRFYTRFGAFVSQLNQDACKLVPHLLSCCLPPCFPVCLITQL